MKTKTKKADSWITGGFVPITLEMINSQAYKELNGSALKALILCMRKVKEMNRTERFKVIFSLTYPEARKQGFCDATFWRSMKDLQRVGFIDCVMKGGLRCDRKTQSAYRLSLRWKSFGTPNFKSMQSGHCEAINGTEPF